MNNGDCRPIQLRDSRVWVYVPGFMGGEVKVPSLLAQVLGNNVGESVPGLFGWCVEHTSTGRPNYSNPRQFCRCTKEGRCSRSLQHTHVVIWGPSQLHRARPRKWYLGDKRPVKVNEISGEQIRTERARSMASSKLQEGESK